jgi:trafficking protein particle complex subunit 4
LLAATGLHTIATQVAPVLSAGIEKLETDTFKLQCFQSVTGVKFVVTATPLASDIDLFLQGVYELYADYVLKVRFNSFH